MKPRPKTEKRGAGDVISPSNFSRVAGCPGSATLVADCPPITPNAAMERGTKMHENLLKLFTGAKMSDIPSSEAEAKVYDEAFVALMRLRREVAESVGDSESIDTYTEARLDFKWLGLKLAEERGRVDYAFVGTNIAIVIDFKTGRGSEEYDHPEDSWQLRLYACALAKKHPKVKRWGLCYIAPERAEGEKVTIGWLDADAIAECSELAVEAVKLALSKKPPLVVGVWCKWCPAKPSCPEQSRSLSAVGDQSLPVPSGTVFNLPSMFLKATPTERALLWQKLLQAEEYVESVKASLIELAVENPVEGYIAAPSKVDKRWTDEAAVISKLGNKVMEPKLMTPTQAMKCGLSVSEFIVEVPAKLTLKKRGK